MAGEGRKLTDLQQRFVDEYLINADRFWSNVVRGFENECWEFSSSKDALGYGRFHIGLSKNSTMLAHRVAYGLTHGELPEAVCHKCDNPSCCNPGHLFGGTRADNNRDMAEKGRHWLKQPGAIPVSGERHGQSKINHTIAASIRADHLAGSTQRLLAEKFGVSQRTICKVVNNLSWV